MNPPAPAQQPIQQLTAAALREEFDRGFSEPPPMAPHDTRDFVLVRVGSATCALPATQLRGIEHRTRVVPVPSTVAALLGVAGAGGAVVPVFHLGRLLGLPESSDSTPGSSPVLELQTFACVAVSSAPDAPSLGLAFDELLAFARVESRHIFPARTEHSAGTLLFDQASYTEVDVRSLVQTLTANAPPAHPRDFRQAAEGQTA